MTLARLDEDADSAEAAPLSNLVSIAQHRLAALARRESEWKNLQMQLQVLPLATPNASH